MNDVADDELRRLLERRLAASGLDLATALAGRDAEAGGPRLAAVVVLKAFDPASFVAGTVRFAAQLPRDRSAAWYRQFTRTLFLVGDPRRLAARFRFDHASPDGAVAWRAPDPGGACDPITRLLKPLQTEGPCRLDRRGLLRCQPGTPAGAHRRLTLDVADLPLERALVHLNHLACEAVIEGRLGPEDRLDLLDAGAIGPPRPSFTAVRVHRDALVPTALRLYGALEEVSDA